MPAEEEQRVFKITRQATQNISAAARDPCCDISKRLAFAGVRLMGQYGDGDRFAAPRATYVSSMIVSVKAFCTRLQSGAQTGPISDSP
jgi:hypothetical protein